MSLYCASAVFYAAASAAAVALTGSSPTGAAISPDPQPAFAPTGALEEVDGTAIVQERTQRVQPQRGKRDVVDDESTAHATSAHQSTSGGAIRAGEKKVMKTTGVGNGKAGGTEEGMSQRAHVAEDRDKTLRAAEGPRIAVKTGRDRSEEGGRTAEAVVELHADQADGYEAGGKNAGGRLGDRDENPNVEENTNTDILERLITDVHSKIAELSVPGAVEEMRQDKNNGPESSPALDSVVPSEEDMRAKMMKRMRTPIGSIVVVDEAKGDVLVTLNGEALPGAFDPAPGSGEHNYVAVVVTKEMFGPNSACEQLFSTVSRDERGFARRTYEQMRAWMTASQDRRTKMIKNCLDMAKKYRADVKVMAPPKNSANPLNSLVKKIRSLTARGAGKEMADMSKKLTLNPG